MKMSREKNNKTFIPLVHSYGTDIVNQLYEYKLIAMQIVFLISCEHSLILNRKNKVE